jgi:predicted Rossmann fold nucleotide-binding protein DprA/Smf involved in DNA uptake
MSIDELSIKAKIEMNQMAHVLMALEFKDLIKVRPGNKYKLK